MIRELIEERLDPAAPRRALGSLGPSHDVCPPAAARRAERLRLRSEAVLRISTRRQQPCFPRPRSGALASVSRQLGMSSRYVVPTKGGLMNARRAGALLVLLAGCIAATATAGGAANPAVAATGCQLPTKSIKHVIYIQFDNTHLTRDNPNVPSDLEQMPHLLSFLEGNGTMLDKHYTILISHTGGGILSSLTGLYPDRMGTTVSNSYDYYNPATGKATFTSAFKYWTAPVAGGVDNLPNMVNGDSGTPKNTPAPWVSYTRAGCDVGNVSVANTVLENNGAVITPATTLTAAAAAGATSITVASANGYAAGQQIQVGSEFVGVQSVAAPVINLAAPLQQAYTSGTQVIRVDPTGDMTTIFGKGTPEWNEGKAPQLASAGTAARALAQTDFVGIAVHCGRRSSSICNSTNGAPNAKSDPLPDEPGGYEGYKALFGAKYVDPAITGGGTTVNDVFDTTPIADPFGQPGFPGFDSMSAANTLGYVARMQEAGIPITYAYISDVHDNHSGLGAYGPGEAGYVAALKSYDDAFGKFFTASLRTGSTRATRSSSSRRTRTTTSPASRPGLRRRETACAYNTAAGHRGRRQAAARHLRRDERAARRRYVPARPGRPPQTGRSSARSATTSSGLADRAAPSTARLRHLVRLGAELLHRQPAAGGRRRRQRRPQPDAPGVRAKGRRAQGLRPVRRRVAVDLRCELPRRRPDAEGVAHDQRRPAADDAVHDVRRARLLLPDVQPLPVSESGVPERLVRVDPRRLLERHRADVARCRRAGSEERRSRRRDVERPHRHRPDDDEAPRAERRTTCPTDA